MWLRTLLLATSAYPDCCAWLYVLVTQSFSLNHVSRLQTVTRTASGLGRPLALKKPVILCGDLNVAHKEIDLTNPKAKIRSAGFTQEERDGFDDLLNESFLSGFGKEIFLLVLQEW